VDLAKSEQRLDHLRARLRQIEQDQHERQRAVDDGRSHLEQSSQRAVEAEQAILQAEAEVASLFLEKEAMAAEIVAAAERRETLRSVRQELAAEVQRLRGAARKVEAEMHQQELSAGQLRHERGALADRLREDYGIELAEIGHAETDGQPHVRSEVEEEIASLRRKIANVGSVNLEALTELDDLESRFTDLSTQFRDLTSAKNSLEQIIEKINTDSRRLFSETLETIRVHFQGLFRKLFGGGQADIIVEEDVDLLESGLEIVARPPGKEPRSISLLSGGEKTLTCVALLLAIFRSKPSPFCVLDEVDAALDEANIGRFVAVLQEFLAWTQFIVVTHSKKTMTCAGTLYGVTMQESGISKRVSVRFEDVSETGEILRTREEEPAVDQEPDEQAA
jgi:chromosome segregation protein